MPDCAWATTGKCILGWSKLHAQFLVPPPPPPPQGDLQMDPGAGQGGGVQATCLMSGQDLETGLKTQEPTVSFILERFLQRFMISKILETFGQ